MSRPKALLPDHAAGGRRPRTAPPSKRPPMQSDESAFSQSKGLGLADAQSVIPRSRVKNLREKFDPALEPPPPSRVSAADVLAGVGIEPPPVEEATSSPAREAPATTTSNGAQRATAMGGEATSGNFVRKRKESAVRGPPAAPPADDAVYDDDPPPEHVGCLAALTCFNFETTS
mmetsp:Transcript_7763/g.32121  ORF Transcript_7763/g.32121 Transcript_7763/m.32121 type:complete len:174 (-) Transcript_7763:233-754(-)|eukprot:CAMPEP_0185703726 /NCGR_PEP_ID=MMETSP1164-20130828/15359_1 /TAXON_ID=1104430 /ORGANISM="Chrysoreinhardia sp, Strain CCMP2950" /LENGTH=173 /DNA_ID=CAMNT_0028371033 /DNA_START=21 /DNA_END=542 /DNA_ORIENTATION=-